MKPDKAGFESLVIALFPVGVLLAVGGVALRQMASVDIDIRFFLLFLVICIMGVFFGELFLLRSLEQARHILVAELVTLCKNYLAGQREPRASAPGDVLFDGLVSTINALLDWASTQSSAARAVQTAPADKPARTGLVQTATTFAPEATKATSGPLVAHDALLDTHVQRLAREVASILEGDLRGIATIPPGRVGIIADVCNKLVEQLVELVLWTRYSSEQANETTQVLIDRSISVAQAAEIHLKKFTKSTAVVGKLVALRWSDLQLNTEIIQEFQTSIQQVQRSEKVSQPHEEQPTTRRRTKAREARLSVDLLSGLNAEVERQASLMRELCHLHEAHAAEAALMMTYLSTFAQDLQRLCAQMLQAVEHVNALTELANKWRDSVVSFQLPDDARTRFSLQTGSTSEWIL